MSETTYNRDAWLLGQECLGNFEKSLAPEKVKYYWDHKDQIPGALERGFVLPGTIIPSAVSVEMSGYPVDETDLSIWFGHMELFASEYFGTRVVLRDMFSLPTRLPWKQVLPVFDPGLTNREMVDKALKARKLSIYESLDVTKYVGSGAVAPTLHIIERSIEPRSARGLPPRFARLWFEGRQTVPLNLRGYGIGTSLWHKVEKQFLDSQATATWFPENTAPGGPVAYGCCARADGRVGFDYNGADCGDGIYGFREAILLKPRT